MLRIEGACDPFSIWPFPHKLILHIFSIIVTYVTMSQPPNMAAPSIPNLLSLRGTRGGGRGRGRGSGRGGHSHHTTSNQAQHDATIQGTDTDASVSRLSAVDLGYLEDPYAQCFVQGQQSNRRLPLINRGRLHTTYLCGSKGVRRLIMTRHIHQDNGSRHDSQLVLEP